MKVVLLRSLYLYVAAHATKDGTSACRGALLLQLLDSYATRYAEMLDGRSEALPVSELAGGARIRHIYQDIFVKGLDELNPSRYCCVLSHLERDCSTAIAKGCPS